MSMPESSSASLIHVERVSFELVVVYLELVIGFHVVGGVLFGRCQVGVGEVLSLVDLLQHSFHVRKHILYGVICLLQLRHACTLFDHLLYIK